MDNNADVELGMHSEPSPGNEIMPPVRYEKSSTSSWLSFASRETSPFRRVALIKDVHQMLRDVDQYAAGGPDADLAKAQIKSTC